MTHDGNQAVKRTRRTFMKTIGLAATGLVAFSARQQLTTTKTTRRTPSSVVSGTDILARRNENGTVKGTIPVTDSGKRNAVDTSATIWRGNPTSTASVTVTSGRRSEGSIRATGKAISTGQRRPRSTETERSARRTTTTSTTRKSAERRTTTVTTTTNRRKSTTETITSNRAPVNG